jgi:hypothetical protein
LPKIIALLRRQTTRWAKVHWAQRPMTWKSAVHGDGFVLAIRTDIGDDREASSTTHYTINGNEPMARLFVQPASTAKNLHYQWRTAAVATLAFVVLAPLPGWGQRKDEMLKDWQEAEKETDRLDPRWRLTEIEADREKIPEKENSALHIIAVLRKTGAFSVDAAPNYEQIFDKLPTTTQLNKQQSELIRGELAKIAKPLAQARKLKDMPRGRFPITYSDDFIGTLLPDHQNSRHVVEWLQNDALLLAQDENCGQAVESCQAMLNAGRTMDGDPLLNAHMIRIAVQHVSVITLERVLAQGQASEERLRAMQAILAREMKQSNLLPGWRGERAGMHMLCENARTGKVKIEGFKELFPRPKDAPEPTGEVIRTRLVQKYPEFLRQYNRLVEIAKLPMHQRHGKIQEFEKEIKQHTNPLVKLFMPSISKLHQAECRGQALLRSAVVSVACERYRLKHANWPKSLDVLGKENLLDAIPTDPMDGKPLRYRRTKDGIVVYSIGFDLTDNQGHIDRERLHDPGVDIGFRLWNEKSRRQAPLPPVALPEGD